jgi:hypothetical protein
LKNQKDFFFQQGINEDEEKDSKQPSVDGNFSFLYSRESDVIGSRVPKPEIIKNEIEQSR